MTDTAVTRFFPHVIEREWLLLLFLLVSFIGSTNMSFALHISATFFSVKYILMNLLLCQFRRYFLLLHAGVAADLFGPP